MGECGHRYGDGSICVNSTPCLRHGGTPSWIDEIDHRLKSVVGGRGTRKTQIEFDKHAINDLRSLLKIARVAELLLKTNVNHVYHLNALDELRAVVRERQ